MKLIGHYDIPPFAPGAKWFRILEIVPYLNPERETVHKREIVHKMKVVRYNAILEYTLDADDFVTIECLTDEQFEQYKKDGVIE